MDVSWQILALMGSNILLMVTFFGISVSLHNGLKEDIRALTASTSASLNAIQEEMKDFHGRLCAIEERERRK